MKKFWLCFYALLAAATLKAEDVGNWRVYSYDTENLTCQIGEYLGSSSSVIVPAFLKITVSEAYRDEKGDIYYRLVTKTFNVTEMDPDVFRGNESLISVYFEPGIGLSQIYSEFFTGCSSLTSVTIPEGVTTIGQQAFAGCRSLMYVKIPSSVKEIYRQAFYKCDGLTKVDICDIGAWCGIDFKESYESDYDSRSSNPLYYGANLYVNGNLVVDLIIPHNVSEIKDGAFMLCKSIETIKIPGSVTNIGYDAFRGCSNLKNLQMDEGVENIGKYAFYSSARIESVSIPSSIKRIESNAFHCSIDSIYIADLSAWCGIEFAPCWMLVDVSNPLSRAEHLYLRGEEIRDLIIPYGTPSIKQYTFYNFKGIRSVTIPDSVTSIGADAFSGCSSLAAVTIPDSVKTIGSLAFEGCSSLVSMTIPDSVTTIGMQAFKDCSSLKEVHITDLAKWCAISFGGSPDANPCYHAHHLYLNNVEIRDLIIPDSVIKISDYTFESCRSITSVTIPNSVTTIGTCAFDGCSSLASVEIPEGVTTIGAGAFDGCRSLASVTIPDIVTKIENCTFRDCRSLKSITIPQNVQKIGELAFKGCEALERVDISDLAAWCNIDFERVRTASKVWDYSSNPLVYAHHLFCNGQKVEDCVIPEGVTKLYPGAFKGGTDIKVVVIPDSVTVIGHAAFSSCAGLSQITIPKSVTNVQICFEGCISLNIVHVETGDTDRVKELMRGKGVDVDTLTFVEDAPLPEATYSHDFNGGMTTPSSTLGGVIIPSRHDSFDSFTHVIRVGEPNGVGAIPSTAGGKNGQYGSTELVDDEADWTITMVAKAANVPNGTFWSIGADCWSEGHAGMALVLADATHVSLVRWQKGGDGNETLLSAEVVDATEALHIYTVSYNHETEAYTLFVDASEAAVFVGARTFTTNGYQIGSVHGGAGNVNLATGNGFVLDDFAVWNDFAAQVEHARMIAAKYSSVIAVGSYTFDWPKGETAWRNDISFSVGIATGITPYAGDTIRFATGETITFASGSTIPSGIELIIDSGTLKLASGTPSKVTVNAGATLDVAGTPDRNFAIVLNGGTLTNSGNNIGSGYMQTPTIELAADSFIDSSRNFGSIASGYQGHSFNLNGHKLTKRGTGIFYIANAAFNSGTIDIEAGSVELMKGYTIPSGVTLTLTGSQEGELSVLQVGTQTGAINLSDKFTVITKFNSIPNFVKNATEWTGKLVIAANISGLASIGANTALYGNASEIEIASGASCTGYFPNSARTSRITINGTFTVNDGYTGESKSATVSELAGSGTIVDGIAANNKGAAPIIKVEKYADWTGTIQEATNRKLTVIFLEPISPTIEGDDAAEVTGDAETGFVVKPSEGTTEVVITIPEGVDAEKVTIEVSTAVQSVKANGATIKVVKGEADITAFLDIPAAVDGVVNLGAAEVKEAIVKETMDTEKGAIIELSAENPTLTTTATKPGLTYTLFEGTTLDSMGAGASKLGNGTAWTPEIKVKGGASAFYSIKVTK